MTNRPNLIPFPIPAQSLPYQLLKLYRLRTGLHQHELAAALGLNSRRMVQYWEADNGLPKAENLQKLITVFLQTGAFRAGEERQEAETLWVSVKDYYEGRSDRLENYPIFDKGWFEDLFNHHRPTAIAGEAAQVILLPLPQSKASTAELVTNNWPIELTSFIGREKEISEVQQLLTMARLVTLTGTGGTGKTRLALKVAEAAAPQFSDGIIFVSLANLTDPALVAPTVAQALGLAENVANQLNETLKNHLKNKKLLLVLDNFEQIIAAAPMLGDWLAHTHYLKVLVTSRIVLNLYGEQHYHLAPFPLPAATAQLQSILENPAVMLFVERSRFYRSDFTLTPVNSKAVIQICTLLDGLPLALELAAARIKFLSPQKLLEKLTQHRLKMPGESAHNLTRRHQTLYDTLDWSYSLLNKLCQQMFRRLAVFTHNWTLEEAEAVCGGGELAVSEIADLIARLINHSLLTIESQNQNEDDGELRYYMLETIREYALEKLVESGDIECWYKAIAHFNQAGDKVRYTNFSAARLHYSDGLRAVSYLPQEAEKARQQADLLVRYVSVSFAVVDRPQTIRTLEEAIAQMEKLVALEALPTDKIRLGWLRYWYGYLFYFLEGNFGTEYPQWQAVLATANELNHAELLTVVKMTIGRVLMSQGYQRQAEPYLRETIALLEKSDNWTARINAKAAWALTLVRLGHYAESVVVAEQALAEARRVGNLSRQGWAYFVLSSIHFSAENLEKAFPLSEEAITILRQTNEVSNLALALYVRGVSAGVLGKLAEARESLEEMLALLQVMNLNAKGICYGLGSRIATCLSDYEQALYLGQEAVNISLSMNSIDGIALGHWGWAVALAKKNAARAEVEGHFQQAISAFELGGSAMDIANTHEDLGEYYQNIGDNEAAIATYRKSAAMLESFGMIERATKLEQHIAALSLGRT